MEDSNPATAQPTNACSCRQQPGASKRVVQWTTVGGLLAAMGVCAACCLLPFALLSIGVAGAWVSTLDALAPYKWILVATTAVLLGYGFYAVYWKPVRCAAGAACTMCGSDRSVRFGLWIATVLAMGGVAFEYLEPYLAG